MTFPTLRRAPARRSIPAVSSPGAVLGIVLTAYLLIIIDVSVGITALPSIRDDLGFSPETLSWVQNSYTLAFGGLLLLGARAGDILGRRRVFIAGVAVFTLASMVAGLAQTPAQLLSARVVQGMGAAVIAPATLSLLTTSFREGADRVRALSLYSATVGAGGSAGLVIGGLLTSWLSWRWGMFVNVPVGAALLVLAPRVLPETPRSDHHFDFAGAATSTLGMTALVFGFVRAAEYGWGDGATVGSFAAAVLLLAGFVASQRRAEQPITPLRLFASRERSGAYVARILMVGGVFSMFFFVTQYLQEVLHYSPLETGLAFLPQTLVLFAATRVVPRVSARVSPARLMTVGIALALVGMAWLTRLDVTTAFFPGIAVPLMLLGAGVGTAFIPLTAAGVAGVAAEDAGAASGLVNTSHQLGGSVGVAVMVTVFAGAGGDFSDRVATALDGSAISLGLALIVVSFVMHSGWRVQLRPRTLRHQPLRITMYKKNRTRPHVRPLPPRQRHRRDVQEEYVRELLASAAPRSRTRPVVLRRSASAM